MSLSNLRFRYASVAVNLQYCSGAHDIRHSQFVNCGTVFQLYNTTIHPRNVLVSYDSPAYNGSGAILVNADMNSSVRGEHMTLHRGNLRPYGSSYPSIYLTNSLLAAVSGSFSGLNNQNLPSDTGVFAAPVGAGSHYLANNTYRNIGTTAINPSLLTELKTRTTYPPEVLTTDFTLPTMLSPLVQRDIDGPDCGYHFDPIDYAWSGLALSSTLVLTNGVAVAIYGTNGTILLGGAKFISEGSPLALNRLVRYGAVQDAPIAWGTSGAYMSLLNLTNAASPPPEIRMRFTEVSLLADTTTRRYLFDNGGPRIISALAFSDCHLRAAYINLESYANNPSTMTLAFTNNFLQRVNFTFRQGHLGDTTPVPLYMWNNLVIGSTLTLQGGSPQIAAWAVHDNLFDAGTISASTFPNSHNAYTAATALPGTLGNDNLSLVPNYQSSSVLGTNYYPLTGALASLINTGSRNRDIAGLFHHTVRVDQLKEGADGASPLVDKGFHYIALVSGLPPDTDGDGIPDFVEDRNGNNSVDTSIGETDWQTYQSQYGGTSTLKLQVFTPLK